MIGVFGFCSISIMLLRLVLRKVRGQPFNFSDYLTVAAVLCVASRTGFITMVVLWGNNNLTAKDRASTELTATEIYHREVGSKLTLVDRSVYNT